MSFLSNIFGFGGLAKNVGSAIRENTEVFHVNETEEMHANAERFQSALSQYEAEFQHEQQGWFGSTIDGMNRLPRPVMALGTILLFAFALYDPDRFTTRMQGLQEVPDPLWWLMGAIVSFYFGARELHYFRAQKGVNVTPKPIKHKAKPAEPPKAQAAKAQAAKHAPQAVAPANAPATAAAPQVNAHPNLAFQVPKSSDNRAINDWIQSRQ